MGKTGSACFDIVSCGKVPADHEDIGQTENTLQSRALSKKWRWSFRKRSGHHRVLSTTVISEPLPLNKEITEDSVNGSSLTENSFAFEKIASPKKTDDSLPPLSKSADTDEASDPNNSAQESAATVIQAAIRRFLAYKELRKLKGVVKLQAAIRGHQVRRQAAGTLRCVQAIVKMQALVRARLHRSADAHPYLEATESFLIEEKKSCSSEKILKNPFVRQLLKSTPKSKPIHITCDHSRSDSAWKWLERWMTLSTPEEINQDREKLDASDVADEEVVPALHSPSPVELSPISLASSSEECLESLKKNDLQAADEPEEQSTHFTKSTSFGARKPCNPAFAAAQAKFEELSSANSQKSANSSQDSVKPVHLATSECGTEISISSTLDSPDRFETEGAGEIVLEIQNLERSNPHHQEEDILSQDDSSKADPDKEAVDTATTELQEAGTGQAEQNGSSVNSKRSKGGRNSFTKKHRPPAPAISNNSNYSVKEAPENGETNELRASGGRLLPSYMQATESARAKLSATSSPKSSPDVHREVNSRKRHSLPLVNGKHDSSPRVLRASPSSSAERRWQR